MTLEQGMVLGLLVVPTAAAVAAVALGPRRRDVIRKISLGASVVTLVLAVVLAGKFMGLTPSQPIRPTFQPRFVPGAPGVHAEPADITLKKDLNNPHATSWKLLRLGPGTIRFYLGLDGLNIWLVVLTALLMVPAVLASWNQVKDRVHEFFAWLLLLEAALMGIFLAFDIVLFYVFFELSLVPLFFLIGIWGGPERRYAARKFFIYTLAGSMLTFLGVLAVVLACYERTQEMTFSIPRLVEIVYSQLANLDAENLAYWKNVQFWVFLALAAGFAVKVPLVPLHTWLPLAHVEAPTAGSVILAGVLLKVGAYGFLRLCLPLAPDASLAIGLPLITGLAAVGIVYGAFCAFSQNDVKKLVAYSSVSHLGLCMLGMFALNVAGLSGSLLQMINHGLSTGALFLLVGMLYERYHTRHISDYGGMASRLPLFGCFLVFICLSSVGLPGLNGFVGEVLVLGGILDQETSLGFWPMRTVAAVSGIILGAWYLFTMLRRLLFGTLKEPAALTADAGHAPVHDLNPRELAALIPIALLCVVLGVYPQPFLRTAEPDIRVVADIADRARARAKQSDAVTRRPGDTTTAASSSQETVSRSN